MAVFKYILDGKEVSEAKWRLEHNRRQKRLIRAGVNDGVTQRHGANTGAPLHDVMAAHDERYRKLYHEPPPPVIEDYRSEEAKKTWPRYRRVKTPFGWKEGPERFRSRDEEATYERTYGFNQEVGKRVESRR